jgi:hypothetical protein
MPSAVPSAVAATDESPIPAPAAATHAAHQLLTCGSLSLGCGASPRRPLPAVASWASLHGLAQVRALQEVVPRPDAGA